MIPRPRVAAALCATGALLLAAAAPASGGATMPATGGVATPTAAAPTVAEPLNLVFVLDGLRPDSVNPVDTPNLHRLRQQGTNFPNSHSVVPTVTRVNSAALGTGNQPGTNGIVGNSMYVAAVNPTTPFSTSEASQLLRLRETTGTIALTPTLAERLEEKGKSLVALGSGSSGGTLLLNASAPDGVGVSINVGSADGPLAFPTAVGEEVTRRFGPPPVTAAGTAKVDYMIRVLNEYVIPDLKPDVAMTWLTEPDGSQHQHSVGSPEALATIRNDDRNIGLVLARLQELGLADKTNIMVVSDHGFSLTTYGINIAQELVAAGLKASADSDDVVVASTGSVAIHVKNRDPQRIRAIAEFLRRREDVDNVFTAVKQPRNGRYRPVRGIEARTNRVVRGWVDGTFSLELIHHANPERGADIVASFPWGSQRNAFGVPGTAATSVSGTAVTGPRTGPASTHGSFSPWDITNTFFAWGVDFKDGETSLVPAGNVDVAPTLMALEGLRPAAFDGRALTEAINGGPDPSRVPFTTRVLSVAASDGSYRGGVQVSEVGRTRYIDQAQRFNR